MNKDLQNTQGASMAEEMKASGQKNKVDTQTDGESVYQTRVMSSDDIDSQMQTQADGSRAMRFEANNDEEATARLLQDAEASVIAEVEAELSAERSAEGSAEKSGEASGEKDACKAEGSDEDEDAEASKEKCIKFDATRKVRKKKDNVRFQVDPAMFEEGGAFHGVATPVFRFNIEEDTESYKDYRRAPRCESHANGTRIENMRGCNSKYNRTENHKAVKNGSREAKGSYEGFDGRKGEGSFEKSGEGEKPEGSGEKPEGSAEGRPEGSA